MHPDPDTAPAPSPRAGAERRALALAALAAAVLLAHGLLLGVVPLGLGDDHQDPARPTPLQVRQIALVAAPAPAAPAPPAPPALAMADQPTPAAPTARAMAATLPPRAVALPAPVAAPAAAASQTLAAPATIAITPVAAADVMAVAAVTPAAAVSTGASSAASAVAASAAAPAPDGEPVPVYATRLPPPTRLLYDLKRGLVSGKGELLWRPADGRYRLTMEGTALSLSLIGWSSQGLVDGAGIAPERFVDRRRGRDLRAANFQRDKGLITFSGPAITYPLLPGAQDRLSWMLQLPAIVAADAAAFGPGARIAMFVAGARGDGDVWRFAVLGSEAIVVPAGRVASALHLRREPRKAYDTQVDVWLDPARGHLPVRVRLAVAQTDDATEFLLREQQPP